MTDKTEYESAWAEGAEETAETAGAKLAAAKKAADTAENDEYITAYADIDNGQSVNGESLKTVTPKDKTQEAGNIATNKEETK